MNDSNQQKIQAFVLTLKGALDTSDSQSEPIITEVRSDLEAHVESLIAKGSSEDEAVEQAINDLGNPFELAHSMKKEVPPFGGTALTAIRYGLATLLIGWTLIALWSMRAGSYGFSATLISIIVLFHLPLILLIWPRIVWRRNYLFGLIPAGLGLIAAFIFAVGGIQTETTTISIPAEGETQLTPALVEPRQAPDPTRIAVPISIGLGVFSIVLLLAMQQRSQRRAVIAVVLLGAGAMEAIYQVEEVTFRREQTKIYNYLEAAFQENGTYPTREEFDPTELELISPRVSFHLYDATPTLFWTRPLCRGYAIVSSSNGDRIRVQD